MTLGMAPTLQGPRARYDEALVWGCAAVAVAVTVWLWLVVTVVTIDAARGAPRIRRGVPEGVRRILLVVCGAALTAGLASPALAAGGAAPGPEVLTGLRLPERVGVEHVTRVARSEAAPVPSVAIAPARGHIVSPGDSLWSIAAERLGPDATPAEIASAWPHLYAANRDLIGPDPARIEPGQHLILPTEGDDRDAH
jgi:hypothetical protein